MDYSEANLRVSRAEVIVADDDRAIRESLASMLGSEGHTVRAVSNGAQALEAHRVSPAGLIVLDLMMPGVDGLTACRVLRSEGDRVPILVGDLEVDPDARLACVEVSSSTSRAPSSTSCAIWPRMPEWCSATATDDETAVAPDDTASTSSMSLLSSSVSPSR